MKTIGLIGGMSWSSTARYYRFINELVHARLGGLHSARTVIWSVDFAEHLRIHERGGWDAVAQEAVEIGLRLHAAGADFLLMCVNTLHVVADQVESRVPLPLLHIADVTRSAIEASGLKRVGLLGTRHVMGESFYRDRITRGGDLEVLIPEPDDFRALDSMIFDKLVVDCYDQPSRTKCLEIIDRLENAGAEGIVLGCTELPILLEHETIGIPIFDTLRLHAEAAVETALA